MGRELPGGAITAAERPDPLGESKQGWMGQWWRERGGEAKRLPVGFTRVLAALTLQGYGISPRPSKWLQLGSIHTSGTLFQFLGAQKTRSPAGVKMKLCIGCAVSSHLAPKSQWNYRAEPGLDREVEGWELSSKSEGICISRGTALFSSIAPMAFIPASWQLSLL